MPRDREGSFEPKIVKKCQKRLSGVDEMVISLAAKGQSAVPVAGSHPLTFPEQSGARPQ